MRRRARRARAVAASSAAAALSLCRGSSSAEAPSLGLAVLSFLSFGLGGLLGLGGSAWLVDIGHHGWCAEAPPAHTRLLTLEIGLGGWGWGTMYAISNMHGGVKLEVEAICV